MCFWVAFGIGIFHIISIECVLRCKCVNNANIASNSVARESVEFREIRCELNVGDRKPKTQLKLIEFWFELEFSF